ncbi:MAG: single-stranded DNA-binding protein [Patescibacteria group bacterium]|nr:single-stranded DNA-binding protein [Patescibacteria group bacterium]
MYLNKVTIIGNLTRDPELKAIPSGFQVVNLGVATNRVWKDKEGNKQEAVEYHNIVAFGKQAENIAQYLKKGSSILVEGRLQTRSWEADGIKKYRTEIVAEKVQFGPKRNGGNNFNQSEPKSSSPKQEVKDDQIEYPTEEINPEDIPF